MIHQVDRRLIAIFFQKDLQQNVSCFCFSTRKRFYAEVLF